MHLHMRRGAVIALLAALAAGCGGGSGDGTSSTGGPATTQAQAEGEATSSTAAGPTASSVEGGGTTTSTVDESATTLADGRHAVRIITVSDTSKTVRFDLIQFLTGEAANQAAAEDGEESPPPNDYYIRNVNPRLRTLPIAPSVTVTVNVLAAEETGSSTKDTKISLTKLASYPADRIRDAVFWLTVSHGQVTRIEEQYLP